MEFNNEEVLNDQDDRSINQNKEKPRAYRVNDEDNINEASLERPLYGDSRDNMNPVMEGTPMGGQKFGHNNVTPSANDKNNPSQYAGNTNAYFDRTEPMEEHPEDNNFKTDDQQGEPDYSKAQARSCMTNETPKPEKVEKGNSENDRPHKQEQYQEGTVDNDSEPNIPGPNELPDQQKVGEDLDDNERQHIET